jgi:tetratricopeptide (TPR) repeat protein
MTIADRAQHDSAPETRDRREQIIRCFEDAWRQGGRPAIEEYLVAGVQERRALLVELVTTELACRLRIGEPARVEEYLGRFLELVGDTEATLALVAAEYEQRRRREPGLDAEEYARRFPGHKVELQQRLRAGPAGSESATPPVGSGTTETLPPIRASGPDDEAATLAPAAPASAGGPPAVPGYEILGELGRGGMGVVYQARQVSLERVVALKMILAGAHAGPDDLARFRREAEAVARLQHPNIVQIHEVGEAGGLPYFSLEFCPGGSLGKRLQGTPLPAREAAALVETLARAMHAAHEKGVVHRDLKPANVLLAEDGTPKVSDFGLAKLLGQAGETASGAVLGTPSYMAPEQAGGRGQAVGPAADVYALGAILYECLTGRPPFRAATALDTLLLVVGDEPVPPRQLQPGVPRDLDAVVLKCLEKDPKRRYATARELADDLHRFLHDQPVLARPPSTVYQLGKFARRHKALVAGGAAVLLALVIGIIGTSIGLIHAHSEWGRAEGQRLRAEGEWQRAEEERAAAQAAEQKKGELLAASYRQTARLAMTHGAWQDALKNIDRALESDPADVDLHLDRVRAWAALDEAPRAREEVKQLAGRTDLGDRAGLVLLWQADLVLCQAADDAGALATVAKARRQGLPPAEAEYAAGLLADTSPEAVEHFRRAVEVDPFHQRANGMLIQLLTFLGYFTEARDRAAFAEQVFPDDPTVKVLHGQIEALQGNLHSAYALVNEAPQLRESQRRTARARMDVLAELNHLDALVLGIDPGNDLFPALLKVLPQIVTLSQAAGADPEQTADLFLPIPPILFRPFRGVPSLATMILFRNYAGVIRALDDAIRIHPDGVLYLLLGLMLVSGDREAEAEQAFLAAAGRPSFVPVRRAALMGAIDCEWILAGDLKESPPAVRRNRFFEVSGPLGALFVAAPSGPLPVLPALYLRESPLRRALRNTRAFVALGRVGPEQAALLADVGVRNGDFDLARAIVGAWERQDPKDMNAWRKRALVELRAGAAGPALQAARKVLDAKPDDKQALDIRKQAAELLRQQAEQLSK